MDLRKKSLFIKPSECHCHLEPTKKILTYNRKWKKTKRTCFDIYLKTKSNYSWKYSEYAKEISCWTYKEIKLSLDLM